MDQQEIKDLVQSLIDSNNTVNQFAVSQTPFHIHNGFDSSRISFSDLKDRTQSVAITLFGTQSATAGNYGTFFIAPFPCSISKITEVHSTAGTDGGTVELQVEKLTGTTAPGSGTNLLTTAFNLKSTINTVVTGVLSPIAGAIQIADGDRLALKLSGTPTSVNNVAVVVTLIF